MSLSEEELATLLHTMASHIFDHLPEPARTQAITSLQEEFALTDRQCIAFLDFLRSFKEYIRLNLSGQESEEAMAKFQKLMATVEGIDEENPDTSHEEYVDPCRILDALFLRFPEPERSIAIAKHQELIKFTIDETCKCKAQRKLASRNSAPHYLPAFYIQLVKKYRIGEEIVSILGVTEENCFNQEAAIKSVQQALTEDVRRLEPTSENIYWDALPPEGGEYVEDSFTYTGVIFEEIVPHPYIYVHSSPPILVSIKDGVIQARKNYDAPKEWPTDFAQVIDAFDGLLFIIKMFPEPELSIGWKKYTEVTNLVLDVTRKQARPLLDMPLRYVQFAKEYQVGESTVCILGLTFEAGYSDEEAIEKIRFSMTSDIAVRKFGPICDDIYWEAPPPDGGEYIEGSFVCTEVVCKSVPEHYIHPHYETAIPIRVVDGGWQYNFDDIPPYQSEYDS